MPTLDLADSRALLVAVVESLYAQRHSPIPGAVVKATLLSRAESEGVTFNEQELGFKNFAEFVKSAPGIALQFRIGSDMLLAPQTAGEILSAYAEPLPRLRRDFWRAFIEFSIPDTIRLYDPDEDKIFYEAIPPTKKGIPIEPISSEVQIEWRRTFAEEQSASAKDSLLHSLNRTGTAVFNEFAQRLRENPPVRQAWNRYLQKRLTDHVAAWATESGVTKDRWSSGISQKSFGSLKGAMPSKTHSVGQRAELYNFLDSLPIEDLLQLRVPLEWMLKVMREKM